ncbi:5'/3'-nucleotidase SurE [Aquihabitans sp. McL0605]|uniref:5'/3'-nucleotidase SurE n=1 Tax=Aquihabitans sp. McL0605 TaxID=3415671 RepID=UPI003CEA3174
MRIQVTNDDGIESEGIHVLARALAATGHEVVVVAPDSNWSGAGAALGDFDPRQPLAVRRVEVPGAPDIEAWSLAGPPALTVMASFLGAFGDPPDLVVSGINAGHNTGRSVLHSGTVGAALTAQNLGCSGLAVSTGTSAPWYWETAAEVAVEVLDLIIAAPRRSVLNLNVPACPRAEVGGIRWARLAPFGAVRAAVASASEEQIEFTLEATEERPGPDTDQGCLDLGYASLTTLVGVVEAWPDGDLSIAEIAVVDARLTPGADLHPVHGVPDASEHRFLRRPRLGETIAR